jgi:hypothetical protein
VPGTVCDIQSKETGSPMDAKLTDVIGLIAEASAEDLAQVDQAIKETEGQLAALRVFRKVLAAKVTAPPAKSDNGQAEGNGHREPSLIDGCRQKIGEFLAKNGIARVGRVQRELNITTGSFYKAVAHEWFVKTDEGVLLSPSGRQQFVKED